MRTHVSSEANSEANQDASYDEGNRVQAFVYAAQEGLRSALSSIRAHGMRSFLTMLGVIIGVAAVICVVALLQGVTQYVLNEFQGLGGNTLTINSYTSTQNLMIGKFSRLQTSDLELIQRRIDGISNITPVSNTTLGAIRSGIQTTAAPIYATTAYFQLSNQSYPHFGRFITDSDSDTRRRVVVLGDKARDDLKLAQNPVGQFIQIGSEWFKIIGVMETRGELLGFNMDNYVIIPFQTGLALSSTKNTPDIGIRLTVNDPEAVDAVKNRIIALLRGTRNLSGQTEDDFQVRSSESLLGTVARVSSMITLVVAAIVGISLLVGGVGIMNIMLVSVTERTREIGIAKALGAPRHFIMMQFLIEAMLLAVIGGVIGIGLGYLLSHLAAAMIPSFPPPVIPWWASIGATCFCALVGILFGILPASKAANLSPIDALRHE